MPALPDEIAYDQAQLESFLGDVKQCRSLLTVEEGDLDRLLHRTLGPDWTGSASSAWLTRQQEWHTACAELNGILDNLATALWTAKENARRTDSHLTRMFGG